MKKQTRNALLTKAKDVAGNMSQKLVIGSAVALSVMSAAHAETGEAIDLTTGLGAIAVVGGLMASGSLKAVPTYAAWGIRKALSMLR